MASLADRNNNPGNIRNTNIPWHGAVGHNGGFESFETPEHGVRAMAKNLYSYNDDGLTSVNDIVSKWAPMTENNTAAYVAKVSADLGVDPNDDLGSLKNNPDLTKKLIASMADHEGATIGDNGKYTNEIIEQGVKGANGEEMKFASQDSDFKVDTYRNEEGDVDPFTSGDRKKIPEIKNLVSPNWLSTVDSPTYRWTLYVVNNEVWNDPNLLANDDSVLNSEKAFIIAKQGVTTEFTLDNFACNSVVTPGQRHGNTTPGIIQFDLFENLGFTFLDKGLKAGIKLGKPSNLHSQNYILKLEFLGRDYVTGGSTTFPGVFFYPIKLNQIRSSTGPEGTRYNIIAWSMIKIAQAETVTETDVTVKNITTVQDFAKGLEDAYNKGQSEAMNPSDFGKAQVPPKEIKIEFDPLSNVKSIPGTISSKLNNFHLKVQAWGSTSDAADSDQRSANPHDNTKRDVTIERETNLAMTIAQLIQKNCPAWATWYEECKKHGVTPYIVVDPKIKYKPLTKGSMEHKYANVEPMLITLVIKVGLSTATADLSIKDHTEKLADSEFQQNKINSLAIEKSYTHMYSGLNTEVLNYGIEIQTLYVVVDHPSAGMHMHGKGKHGEPQFGTSEIPKKTTAEKSPYLEDIPYTGMSVFNDLVVGGATKTDSAEMAQLNETSIDARSAFAHKAAEMAKRERDAFELALEIKGDPYWMGNMQAVIAGGKLKTPDYSKRDALISFVQWNPNVDKLLTEQTKGELDVVSSGIYKLTAIESRFQGGKFTQTLKGYKDVTTNTLLVIGKLIELSGE